MAEIIDIATRQKTVTHEPSHRDTEYLLSDDDWWILMDMFYEGDDREDIEVFIIEAVSRD